MAGYDFTISTDAAFARYEAVRARLPAASYPVSPEHLGSLADVSDRFDAFVLDAFGVLNVGATPIPGAVGRMSDLRAAGKKLIVLTNAASYGREAALQKYHVLGYDFAYEEVVSSRDVAAKRLRNWSAETRWAAIAQPDDRFGDLAADIAHLGDRGIDGSDAILFLSSADWDDDRQQMLVNELARAPKPVVVANPDIVAPREDGLSREPGYFAHEIADRTSVEPTFFGKPFPDAYDDVKARLPGVAADRIAMVGDTLHTDVMGGAAAGFGTVLVARHGLFAGRDVTPYVTRSGIVPDIVVDTT